MGRVAKASDLVKKREIRQDAQTAREFCQEVGLGSSAGNKLLTALISEGRIRKVFKRVNEKLLPAYIPNHR